MRIGKYLPLLAFFGLIAVGSHWNRGSSVPPAVSSTAKAPNRAPAATSASPVLPSGLLLPPRGEKWSLEFIHNSTTRWGNRDFFEWKSSGVLDLERVVTPEAGSETFLVHVLLKTPTPKEVLTLFRLSPERTIHPVLEVQGPSIAGDEETEQMLLLTLDLLRSFVFTETRNSLGRYEARWSIRSGELEKSIARFENPEWAIESSQHLLRTAKDGAFAESEGQDIAISSENALRFESSFRFRLISRSRIEPWVRRSDSGWEAFDTEKALVPSIASSAPKLTWAECVQKMNGDLKPGQALLRLVKESAKNLRQEPGRTRELQNWVLSRRDREAWSFAVGVFLESDTAEGEAALTQLYRDPRSLPDAKDLILSGLTLAQRPIREATVEFLNEAQNPNALLALGSALRFETDPEAKKRIAETLVQSMASARTPAERVSVIDSWGNSGDEAFFPRLKTELTSSDPQIRSRAALALRFQAASEAETILVSLSEKDPETQVRAAARKALELRENL